MLCLQAAGQNKLPDAGQGASSGQSRSQAEECGGGCHPHTGRSPLFRIKVSRLRTAKLDKIEISGEIAIWRCIQPTSFIR